MPNYTPLWYALICAGISFLFYRLGYTSGVEAGRQLQRRICEQEHAKADRNTNAVDWVVVEAVTVLKEQDFK